MNNVFFMRLYLCNSKLTGMNQPLRGHKGTPFEGGVRVPAFIVDFTPEQRYLLGPRPDPVAARADSAETKADGEARDEPGQSDAAALDSTLTAHHPTPRKPVDAHYSRVFHGMMHISDWLPTLLSYAGVPASKLPARLDGLDFSHALRLAEYEDAVSTADICRGKT
jgi:arylsulfatase A-like enzyme